MNSLDYRTLYHVVIEPVLKYFGFFINNDGIIQKADGSISITLSGKHLYIPSNGDDYFKTKDSSLLVPFNPFKIREHTLLIANFFCKALSDNFRDEDDELEYNGAGDLIDIVSLVKRGPRTDDKLPATFTGVIYEIWCRDQNDVLGKGVDFDGNDIKAIIMAMIDVLTKHSNLVTPDQNYDRMFNYVTKVVNNYELEIEDARIQHSTNNRDIDLSDDLDNVELDDDSSPEVEEDEDDEYSKDSTNPYNMIQEDIWDDMEF